MPAPPAAKPWAAADAGNGCAAPWPASPPRRFRTRLIAMADRRGIAVIGVDPAYTSRWGAQHWRKPLQQQTSDPVTRHHAAATAIGRRGLGVAIRRRPAGPRNGQRTVAGTPPARPDRQPDHGGRHGSSGPPTRPHDAYRSTGEHPPPRPTPFGPHRADSLLLTNEERYPLRSARERPRGQACAPAGLLGSRSPPHSPSAFGSSQASFGGTIVRTEAEEPVSAEALHAIESLISQIDLALTNPRQVALPRLIIAARKMLGERGELDLTKRRRVNGDITAVRQ